MPGLPSFTTVLLLNLIACGKSQGDDSGDDSGVDGVETSCELPTATILELDDEVSVTSDPGATYGWFDPSVVHPAGSAKGYMSYSVVDGEVGSHVMVHTRIASSADGGATWDYEAEVNSNEPLTIDCGSSTCTGVYNHETSSLVHDPDDPDGTRAWKLFTHSYLLTEEGTLYTLGYLAMWTASSPEGPWSGPSNVIGWTSISDLSSDGAATLLQDIDALSDCVAITEPSLRLRSDGSLDLAVGCAYEGGWKIRIEKLNSTDHAQSWTHVASLLGPSDAEDWGYFESVNAAQLFEVEGTEYIIATPRGETAGGFDGYRGCFVVELESDGSTRRCDDGRAKVVRVLDTPDNSFTGACGWDAGTDSEMGYLMSVLRLDLSPQFFHFYASGVQAP